MTTKATIRLGISLGTRTMGIAILADTELLHARVHTFRGAWSKQKLQSILGHINQYMGQYELTDVVLKVPAEAYPSGGIIQLTKGIELLVAKKALSIRFCSLSALHKKYYSGNGGKSSAATTMSVLAIQYPELHQECKKELHTSRKYYRKLFEAIAAVLLVADTSHK